MHHGRNIELDHLFEERVPTPVRERRRCPVAAGRVRVEIAAHKAELEHAALELRN